MKSITVNGSDKMNNLSEIKNRLNKLRRKLMIIPEDDILDDGRDNGDEEQNNRFSYAVHIIKNVGSELANIDLPGVDDEELDKAWKDLWNGHLPEEEYNHHMRYIEYLEKKIEDINSATKEN